MNLSNRTLALAVSLLLIGALLWFFTDIVAYVCIAWVFSMVGQPLMVFFRRHLRAGKFQAGPGLAAVLTLFTFLLLLLLLVLLFLPPVFEQIRQLAGVDYGSIARTLEAPLQKWQEQLSAYGLLPAGVTLEEQLHSSLSDWLEPRKIGTYLSGMVSALGNIGVGIASVLFIAFFFLQEQGMFAGFAAALMPEQYDKQVRQAISDIAAMLSRYFRGLLLQMAIFSTVISVGLMLLGVKNALLIGFVAGLLNIIPYVGPIIGAAFGVVFTISANLDADFYAYLLPLLLKVGAVFVVAQVQDNYISQPLIFSSSVMAHPLEIFIVVLIGAKVNGVLGMVLAIPAYTVFRAVATVFLSEVNFVKRMKERMNKSSAD